MARACITYRNPGHGYESGTGLTEVRGTGMWALYVQNAQKCRCEFAPQGDEKQQIHSSNKYTIKTYDANAKFESFLKSIAFKKQPKI